MDIKDFINRISVRDYVKEEIPQKDIDLIVKAINNSPTSTNAQHFSAILVTDQKTKDFIAKGNFGQKHISEAPGLLLFFADRTRNDHFLENGIENEYLKVTTFQRVTVDATIASAYAQDALMAMGYGSAYIGGLPGFAPEIKEYFNLPDNMFPVVGLSFGKANSVNEFKNKINKVYINGYDKNQVIEEVEKYNDEMAKYYEKRGLKRDFASQNRIEANPEKGIGKPYVAFGKCQKEIIENFEK